MKQDTPTPRTDSVAQRESWSHPTNATVAATERAEKAKARVLEIEKRCSDVMMSLESAKVKLANALHEIAMTSVRNGQLHDVIADQTAEIARLREDAERLEWCIVNNRFPSITRPVTTAYKPGWTCVSASGMSQYEGESARAAIDAARKEGE